MSLPDFIKDKQSSSGKKSKKKKGDFSEKCLDMLAKIKKLDLEKHDELSRAFQSEYCGHNVQKKRIIGFYGQLVHECKILEERERKGLLLPKAPVKSKSEKIKKEKSMATTKIETHSSKKKKILPKIKKTKSPVKKKVKKTAKKKVKKTVKKKVKKTAKKKQAKKSKKTAKKR